MLKKYLLVCRYQRQTLLSQRQDELETMEAEAGIYAHEEFKYFV